MIDVSDLTLSQRTVLRNQISSFRKLNFLLANHICIDQSQLDSYVESDYEMFAQLLQSAKKEKKPLKNEKK